MTKERTLTITLGNDWGHTMLVMAKRVDRGEDAGEVLNFETPAAFFGRLTERRWELVRALQGQGTISLRELARRVERDVKRVHEDVAALVELGLVEKTDDGLVCPYIKVHIDMELVPAAA